MDNFARLLLLVEDRADDVTLMMRAFRRTALPARVEVVRNGAEALAYLTGAPPYDDRGRHPFPTLVILDLKMPGVDGYEVLERMKGDPAIPAVPVVVLTAAAEGGSVSRTYALGADFYFVKPITPKGYMKVAQEIEKLWLALPPAGEC